MLKMPGANIALNMFLLIIFKNTAVKCGHQAWSEE